MEDDKPCSLLIITIITCVKIILLILKYVILERGWVREYYSFHIGLKAPTN